ncbi:hypothetical protein EGM88_04700 [Aureibaculum marinum]|uniref:Uncharacterized protein n=1 Tax=Aureibaculum marinum TaxID=2487930 RepID=A0A3N4NQI5_9FLAO|nr:DUF6526 family protein [Aureibaculum marinum]RPD98504.1 hypothetical protein EGM88_04700 [Aureibaculum marinum]
MNTQNYKNHSRFHPLFHFLAIPLGLIVLISSIVNLVYFSEGNLFSSSLLVVLAFLMLVVMLLARLSALKAQDRAIKAEENFRHYLLTGKPLDTKLEMSQIISLRFASDDEFPNLARRAVEEKLPSKKIKKLIVNWKGDYYRV